MSLPDLNPVSRFRPHLRPLDLASDPPKSPSPRASHDPSLITPPLTPSSSFSSSHTPSTPSDPYLTLDLQSSPEPSTSRLVLLGNVPKSATSDVLKQSLKQCGSIKGTLVRFQPVHGLVVIAFYDSRDAARANAYISQISIQGATLTARLLSPVILRKVCFPGSPQFLRVQACGSPVVLLPRFQLIPGPNAFLDECEALVSISIEDGSLSENQLRDLLVPFGHLQSFYPSNAVRFSLEICLFVPDRLIACHFSAISQIIPTLDVPRHSSKVHTIYASLGLVSEPKSLPLKNSLRTRPQRVPLQNPAESARAA